MSVVLLVEERGTSVSKPPLWITQAATLSRE